MISRNAMLIYQILHCCVSLTIFLMNENCLGRLKKWIDLSFVAHILIKTDVSWYAFPQLLIFLKDDQYQSHENLWTAH